MSPSRSHRERGVTAVVVAIVIGVLCAFVALVINSGHIMSVRGQLQNATDAAALAGVRRLDGTAAGFDAARIAAANYAQLHITDKGKSVTIDPAADVAIGSWNFAAPRDSAFTEITGTTAAALANANAVRVNAGRDASHAAAGGPVQVTMGGLQYVGKDTTDVSASSVAVMGGPRRPKCAVLPLTFSSCSVYNDDGTLKCNSTLTFNKDGGDNMGFTNLTSASGVTPPVMKSILNCNCDIVPSTCPPIETGNTIWVQNGADLAPVAADFRKWVNQPELAPVVDMPGCKFVSAGVGATVLGFVTVTITKVNPPPKNTIELKIDCQPSPPDTPGGGGYFGTPAARPQLVR